MTSPSLPESRIEALDPNFQSAAAADGLRWIDAFEASQVALRGFGWLEENRSARSFRRLPDRAAPRLTEPVQELSWMPASGFLSFFTDSRSISVRVTVAHADPMVHMPLSGSNGVELYLREGHRWIPFGTGMPDQGCATYQRELTSGLPRARREFRLYLPPYRGVKEVAVGIEADAAIEPSHAPAGAKPILLYGTSITQGGCANTAGADYVSILGRELGVDTINFGFSGNGKGEPEIAELIAGVDAEMFILDFAANCPPEMYEERLPVFLDTLRQRRPSVPVVLVTNLQFNNALVDAAYRQRLFQRRDTDFANYVRLRAAGDEHLYIIDGFGLISAGITGLYVDGVHPTSGGFVQIAERLREQLTLIRLSEHQG